jgi:hypothetical protein
MSLSDDGVRENIKTLIEAFATPEQVQERTGFHLYCMEVAAGFISIYRDLLKDDPPGLQNDQLHKNSVHASSTITVHEITQFKNGAIFHKDVETVKEEIKNLLAGTTLSIQSGKEKIERLTKQIETIQKEKDDSFKKVGVEFERHIKQIKIKYGSKTNNLKDGIKKLKAEKLIYETMGNSQVTDIESQLDAAKVALKRAEETNQELRDKFNLSQQIDRIELDLTRSLSRLESSDIKLVDHIKTLVRTVPSASSVSVHSRSTAEIVTDLLPDEIKKGSTKSIADEKNREIESLKQEIGSLKNTNDQLKSDLETEQEKVAASSSLPTQLDAEKKKFADEEEKTKEIKNNFKKLLNFLIKIKEFGSKLKLNNNSFNAQVIEDHMTLIDGTSFPVELIKEGELNGIKKKMKSYSEAMIFYTSYVIVSEKNNLKIDDICIKNIKLVNEKLKNADSQKALMQISAASFGFISPEQAITCIFDAKTNLGPGMTKMCMFSEISSSPNYMIEINTATDYPKPTPPMVMCIIEYATLKFRLLSSTISIMKTWMDASKDNTEKLKIAQSFVSMAPHFIINGKNSVYDSIIKLTDGSKFEDILAFFNPILLGQIFSGSIPRESIISFEDGKKIKAGECLDAAQKCINYFGGVKSIRFNHTEIEILETLHVNVRHLPAA